MSVIRLLLLTLILSLFPLFFSYADHLPLLEGPVPEELTIEYKGLKWVWASPCAGGCGVPAIDPTVQEGWRYCTDDEFADILPLVSFLDSEGAPICAAAYFDNHFQFCDILDYEVMNLTSFPNDTTDDTLLCMDMEMSDDEDTDGVPNEDDNCPGTTTEAVVDSTGCSIDQLCPCEGIDETWKNHGKYVSCISDVSEGFVELGLITENDKDESVSFAARSECGK